MATKETDFTKGKMLPALLRFSVPCIIMNLIQSLFVLTDLFIVGHWASEEGSIAAVTISSSPIWFHTIILMGFGGAVNILVGRAYGAKDNKKSDAIVGTSMTLFAVLGLIFSIELFIFAERFLRLLQTPPEVLPLATVYLRISALGFLPIAGFNLFGAILRGVGNSSVPTLCVAFGLLINLILDIVFVVYLNMGAFGAAVATTLSQFIGFAFAVLYLRVKKYFFGFRIKEFKFAKDTLKSIFVLALPISMQEIFVEISFVLTMVIANTLGAAASAGYGIVLKMWGFTALPAYSFETVLAAVASQNIGATRLKRAKKSLYYCFVLSAIPCWIYVTIMQIIPEKVVAIFTNQEDIIQEGTSFMLSSSWEFAVMPFVFCLTSFFTACGKPTFTMVVNMIAQFAIKIPLAVVFVFAMGGGLYMLGWSFTISTSVIMVIYLLYFQTGRWTKIKKL